MDQMQEYVEVREGICYFRPQGESSLFDAVEHIKSAVAYCRERGIDKLLVNAMGLVGIAVPSLCDRFLMNEAWAQEAKGMVAVALVIQPEFIHPEKFGVTVAKDFGSVMDVHTSEADALTWLSSSVGPT